MSKLTASRDRKVEVTDRECLDEEGMRYTGCRHAPHYAGVAMNGPRKCKGVALITALLIVSIAAVAAASFVVDQQLDVRRTGNLIYGDQAWAYATAGEAWAKVILRRDQQDDVTENSFTDDLTEPWAQPLSPIKLPGGHIVGRITDAQARLNLNNLVPVLNAANVPQELVETQAQREETAHRQLNQLLMRLQLNPALVDAVIDWVDPDLNARGSYGAEDDYYSGLKHPYRAANQPMGSISELRLVKGFTEKVYQKILPFVTALPTHTDINVNTAPVEVLATVPNMDSSSAAHLVKLRQENPFENIQEFQTALSSVAGIVLSSDMIIPGVGLRTQYFDVAVDTRIGYGRASINSLLYRNEQGDIKTIRRAQEAL